MRVVRKSGASSSADAARTSAPGARSRAAAQAQPLASATEVILGHGRDERTISKAGAGRVTPLGSGSRVVRLELARRRLETVERLLAGLPAVGIVAPPDCWEVRWMCFDVGLLFAERLLILVEVYSVYGRQQ